MGFWASLPVVGSLFTKVVDVVDKAVVDKDLREQLKHEINMAMMSLDYTTLQKEIDAKASIILAEAKGESWLQRNWRPILMMVCVLIVANNFLFFPYLSLFFPGKVTMLALPDKLWSLMTVGVGGYILGRSGEKIVKNIKSNKENYE